jgi:hypothetical protein
LLKSNSNQVLPAPNTPVEPTKLEPTLPVQTTINPGPKQ